MSAAVAITPLSCISVVYNSAVNHVNSVIEEIEEWGSMVVGLHNPRGESLFYSGWPSYPDQGGLYVGSISGKLVAGRATKGEMRRHWVDAKGELLWAGRSFGCRKASEVAPYKSWSATRVPNPVLRFAELVWCV
jgi:hypothetical protein